MFESTTLTKKDPDSSHSPSDLTTAMGEKEKQLPSSEAKLKISDISPGFLLAATSFALMPITGSTAMSVALCCSGMVAGITSMNAQGGTPKLENNQQPTSLASAVSRLISTPSAKPHSTRKKI